MPDEQAAARRRAGWRFLWRAIARQRVGVAGAIVSGLSWQAAAVAAPLVVKEALDEGVLAHDRARSTTGRPRSWPSRGRLRGRRPARRLARLVARAHRLRASGRAPLLRDDRGQRAPRHSDASEEDVARALDRIAALERFRSLPGGLETDVRTRGVRLSAGERQLVGLARVALGDPAVVVLDEATSSLDPGTEQAVERALAAVAEGRTVVTIAHRLSTARRADRIAVMEHGRLVETGPHEELLRRGGVYARLWESWQRTGGEPVADPRALGAAAR